MSSCILYGSWKFEGKCATLEEIGPNQLLIMRLDSVFEEGPEIHPPFQTPAGKVGLQICFDLRYPEPALSLKRQGAQIITYPSAFTVPTGRAHWELLLRARAVETQSYGTLLSPSLLEKY